MRSSRNTQEELKARAAEQALRMLQERFPHIALLGLGTGSTAERFLERLAALRERGELPRLRGCVPTSERTARLARKLGLPVRTLQEHPELELTVDGADEVDEKLNLLKGGGGAHTREKIVAWASRHVWVIVDASKLVFRLGERHPVPLEVLPFGVRVVERAVKALRGEAELRLRSGGKPFVTDEGNWILDCVFSGGLDPGEVEAFAKELSAIPGVVEHGLFPAAAIPGALRVIVAGQEGVRVLPAE